jgi:hypothetical protein
MLGPSCMRDPNGSKEYSRMFQLLGCSEIAFMHPLIPENFFLRTLGQRDSSIE